MIATAPNGKGVTAERDDARAVLAVHRPAFDLLCQGCLDSARLAKWPCPKAATAVWYLVDAAAEAVNRP